MEAEELLKYFKKCAEDLLGDNVEVIIMPTPYNPKQKQHNVSFVIMEKVEDGRIPRFFVNVEDNTKHNFK